MKYLTLIYYDTFARLFSAIEDAVKQMEPSADFQHMAIFPSGHLYMLSHGRKSKLLACEIKKPSIPKTVTSEADLEKIAKYHATVGARYGDKYLTALRDRAEDYVSYWKGVIDSYDPDVVIFSGDTRIAAESLQYYLAATTHRAKRYFFEQGPNGTTIFDTKGVNANCSFRKQASSLTGIGYTPEPVIKSEKFKRNPVYRGIDYALTAALRALGKLPPEWDSMSLGSYPKSKYSACVQHGRDNNPKSAQEILVALQVPDDANNIHHNPLNLGDLDLVTLVTKASEGTGLTVRVREHPLYRRRYTTGLYENLSVSKQALLSDSSLDNDLKNAALVVTVNSMTGLDAYLRKIPVITLGNSFYDHLPGIVRVNDPEDLSDTIKTLAQAGLPKCLGNLNPASVFAEMRANHFLPGHYLDKDLSAPASAIASILTKGETCHPEKV